MITTFCPTLGRPSLEYTVASFKRGKSPTDELRILGSGVEKPSWLVEGNGVSFEKCPRSKFYGHDIIYPRVGEVENPYWGFIGDDDCFIPNEMPEHARWLDGKRVVVTQMVNPYGHRVPPIHTSVTLPGKLSIGFMEASIPTDWELPDFSFQSDIWLLDALMIQNTHLRFSFVTEVATKIKSFTEMQVWTWVELGFERSIGPYREWKRLFTGADGREV